MSRLLISILAALLLSQAFMTELDAQALVDRQRHRGERGSDHGQRQERGMSLDEAVQRAQSRFNARAVKAEVSSDGGRRVYTIRLMNDAGRVWTVQVDAQSGRMR